MTDKELKKLKETVKKLLKHKPKKKKERGKRMTKELSCPVCDEIIEIDDNLEKGADVECEWCGSELEYDGTELIEF